MEDGQVAKTREAREKGVGLDYSRFTGGCARGSEE